MFRRAGLVLLAAALVAAVAAPAIARPFPDVIPLPDGFRPEGIATGRGTTFFVGSLADGSVYRGDLRTGEGRILVEGEPGAVAVGLAVDRRNRLFVAGGPTGIASVYDASTGALLAAFTLATGATFVNDVIVTKRAAYFTDSVNPVVYVVPLGRKGAIGKPRVVPLSGDIRYEPGFNANGIAATPNGKTLVLAQSNTGLLFTVDPETGQAEVIDVDGEPLLGADGILLVGRTLYVVRNTANEVVAIRLSGDLSSGRVIGVVSDPDFDVPTTIARHGSRLYAVNARFGTPATPNTDYSVVQLERP